MKKRPDSVLNEYFEETAPPQKTRRELWRAAAKAFERLLDARAVCFFDEKGEPVPDARGSGREPPDGCGSTGRIDGGSGALVEKIPYQKIKTCMADRAGRSVCVLDEKATGAQWWLFLLLAGDVLCGAVLCVFSGAPNGKTLSDAQRLADVVAPRFAETPRKQGREAEAALSSDTTALLSHEFKTPLTVALSSLQLLRRKLQKTDIPDGTKKYLDYAELNIYKSLRFAMNLVDAQNAELGSAAEHEYVDLSVILRDLAEGTRPYAMVSGAKLTFENRVGSPCGVMCDTLYLERILLNLLSNALKHTSEGGEVRLVLERKAEGKTLYVHVEDEGPGIPEKTLGLLFQKFWQGANEHGAGLGLYLSERFARGMGGELWAENRPQGGARFTLCLPVDTEKPLNAVLRGAARVYQSDSHDALLQIELSELLSQKCI